MIFKFGGAKTRKTLYFLKKNHENASGTAPERLWGPRSGLGAEVEVPKAHVEGQSVICTALPRYPGAPQLSGTHAP